MTNYYCETCKCWIRINYFYGTKSTYREIGHLKNHIRENHVRKTIRKRKKMVHKLQQSV